VCASHCAQLLHTILHKTDLIVFPLTLQTITTARMMSIWGKGGTIPSHTKYFVSTNKVFGQWNYISWFILQAIKNQLKSPLQSVINKHAATISTAIFLVTGHSIVSNKCLEIAMLFHRYDTVDRATGSASGSLKISAPFVPKLSKGSHLQQLQVSKVNLGICKAPLNTTAFF